MSCVRSLLFVLFVAVSLRADSVVILQGGNVWYLADGATIAVPVNRVIRLGGNGPVDPPVDPPNENELTRLSSAWKVKVAPYEKKDHHRLGMLATFSVLATRADEGEFSSLGKLQERFEKTRDLILGEDKSKWKEWFTPIGSYLRDNVPSVGAAVVSYRSIAAGLAVEGEAIGPGWVMVVEFIIGLLDKGDIPPRMRALINILLEALFRGEAIDASVIMEALSEAGG